MKDYFNATQDYNHLSLKDLLDARDQYHMHLMHKRNVVATAIGKYRIRKEDPYPERKPKLSEVKPSAKGKGPRTVENSEVRYYSWPCILVFVEKWEEESAFKEDYGDLVPRTLYLSDGRKIPVCIVEADTDQTAIPANTEAKFPDKVIGGGYPVVVDVQGRRHIASIGCLVTDGHKTYALTNRHVAGEQGEVLYTLLNGESVAIGWSSSLQLSRMRFEDVYPKYKGENTYAHLDIGLIEVDDLNYWTAQVYGIGELGKMADLSDETISLRLIGCPVKAFGCASGVMYGQIDALFYRYKAMGGSEYVSDFMIGRRQGKPQNGDLFTHPGDSGTVWVFDVDSDDPDYKNQPVAIQWGGHVFNGAKSKSSFALATCFSTVCDLLDVDLIRSWNIGLDEYWEAVGHYTIAGAAINILKNKNLRKLMTDNLDRISFEPQDIEIKKLSGMSKWNFVPMADVPDMVWKIRGGANQRTSEGPNHFADMDKKDSNGKTLLDLMTKAGDVTANKWMSYYADPNVKDSTKGCLPFRVWQIFDLMVEYVRAGKLAEFVAAAGIISHYAGDACQPLHISYMFNGIPQPGTKEKIGLDVHGAYEGEMINRKMDNMRPDIDARAQSLTVKDSFSDGNKAAFGVIGLMKDTFKTINPKDIVNEYVRVKDAGGTKPEIATALFKKFGKDTVNIMADGSVFLASLWESAWKAGEGDRNCHIPAAGSTAIDTTKLVRLYQNENFLPSMRLKEFQEDPAYNGGAASIAPTKAPAKKAAAKKAATKKAPAKKAVAKKAATKKAPAKKKAPLKKA